MARSKRYQEERKQINLEELYVPIKAVELLKKANKLKFDPSLDLSIRLGIDPKKTEQNVRGVVTLPHAVGKKIKIAAFVSDAKKDEAKKAGADLVGGEELVEEIKKTEKTAFDVAVAEPAMMKSLGKVAKILGQRGLMPNPKNETVTPNVGKAIEELKKGKQTFKNDDTGNIHALVGRLSLDAKKLAENITTYLEAINKVKPDSVKGVLIKKAILSTSQSPGIRLKI